MAAIKEVNILAQRKPNQTILDAILEARGVIDKESFLNPQIDPLISPYVFSDIQHAVDILKEAIQNKDKILIWGDFDCDGVTSTSILYKALKALNANCDYFLPDRLNMGHGLNLKELLYQKSKNKLKVLVTVDCGISDVKEIELLKSLGVKTIITDHHEPPCNLPAADCIINPLAPDSIKKDTETKTIKEISYISGAGVALKLASALLGDNHSLMRELTAICAIGIIADVVPLLGESRRIVARGINEINNGAIKGVSFLFSKLTNKTLIDSIDIAFLLAPRINAAGRLDSPYSAIKLLIDDNPDILNMTIEKLDELNKVRQSLCETVTEQAISMIQNLDSAIVLFNEEWHIGIIGIVASKLVEKYHLPVFLVTKDESNFFRCSIRSPEGYNVSKILNSIKDNFKGFGGHASAGGFSADSSFISFEDLKNKIIEAAKNNRDETLINNKLTADIELFASDLDENLFIETEKFQPYGEQNRKPLFLFSNAIVLSQKTIGKDSNHLAFQIEKEGRIFDCIFWRRTALGFNNGEKIDFIFRPELSEFNGEKKIKLIVESIVDDRLEDVKQVGIKVFDHRQKTGILDKVNSYVASKNGDIKVYANSIKSKKLLANYPALLNNSISKLKKEKGIMFFDYPNSLDELKEIIAEISPDVVHIMRNEFSPNPDDYISLICGMLKYATNNKNGVIDVETVSKNSELDEITVQILLELLEKIESVQIYEDGRIYFINPPNQNVIRTDSLYELFKDEFERCIAFKEYLQTASINEIEEIINY